MPVVASPRGDRFGPGGRRPHHGSPAQVLAAARAIAALAPERSAEQQAIDELADMVIDVAGTPIDERGVAATLESRGLRDVDAVERYGKRDIFDLADDVFVRARRIEPGEPTFLHPEKEGVSRRSFAFAYLRGVFSFLPLLAQVILLVTIGYSQWGWVHFSLAQASTVALAVGLALLGTAGSVQVLGYLGPLFSESDKHTLTRRATYRTLALGMLGSAIFAAMVCIPLLVTGTYPAARIGQAVVYDVLISALWLLNGALYMLKRQFWILVGIGVSVGVVAAVLNGSDWGIYAAHWLGLAVGAAVQLAVVASLLRRRAAQTPEELRLARFPRLTVLRPTIVPLYLYGTAYFALLLGDRAVAWTVGHHPLPVWFNVRYELGLDVALFGAAIGIAFLECALHAFTKLALPRQDRYSGLRRSEHNRWYLRFFARQLAVVVGLLVVGGALMLGLVTVLHDAGALGNTARFYNDPVTQRVFVLGLVGYGFVAIGVASSGVLFNLARPSLATRAIIAGVAVDLVVGMVLSRVVDFSYAVAGLAAGGLVFAILAGQAAATALRRADYYLFAAY
ncbi:MAG TPA: hypothetical protein VMU90_14375 [Solirubrobacteraceae bacterium]|nr:hypothetical protein [Solirubrobacteraceae bacterium]